MTMELHKVKCDYNDKVLKRLVIKFIYLKKKLKHQSISFLRISDSKVFFTKKDVKLWHPRISIHNNRLDTFITSIKANGRFICLSFNLHKTHHNLWGLSFSFQIMSAIASYMVILIQFMPINITGFGLNGTEKNVQKNQTLDFAGTCRLWSFLS